MRRRTGRRGVIPTRALLFVLDKGLCGICGEAVEWADATVEHVWATSRGGSKKLTNTQLAHAECNSLKGNDPPSDEQLARLHARLGWDCRYLYEVCPSAWVVLTDVERSNPNIGSSVEP